MITLWCMFIGVLKSTFYRIATSGSNLLNSHRDLENSTPQPSRVFQLDIFSSTIRHQVRNQRRLRNIQVAKSSLLLFGSFICQLTYLQTLSALKEIKNGVQDAYVVTKKTILEFPQKYGKRLLIAYEISSRTWKSLNLRNKRYHYCDGLSMKKLAR